LALAAVLGVIVWLVATDAPSIRFLVRLYRDKHFLKDTVASWGWAAPLVCIGLGRMWGEPLIRPWLSEHHWNKMNFIIEAEGAILCFILYLIPGFPKDIISYMFGISPMPFWVFAVVSTIGRLPGTWISSYFGAHVGEQQYIYALLFIALVAAICLPLYYYREKILRRFHRKGHHPHKSRGKRLTPPARDP